MKELSKTARVFRSLAIAGWILTAIFLLFSIGVPHAGNLGDVEGAILPAIALLVAFISSVTYLFLRGARKAGYLLLCAPFLIAAIIAKVVY